MHNALLLLREGLRGGRSFVPADASRIFSLYMSEAGQLTMLPQLLAYLREQAPGVRIHVSRLPEKNQGSALEVGQVDMAVGHITTMTTGFHQRLLFVSGKQPALLPTSATCASHWSGRSRRCIPRD